MLPGVLPVGPAGLATAGVNGAAPPAVGALAESSPPHAASIRAESEAATAVLEARRRDVMCLVSWLEKGWLDAAGASAAGGGEPDESGRRAGGRSPFPIVRRAAGRAGATIAGKTEAHSSFDWDSRRRRRGTRDPAHDKRNASRWR
ncbi:hypothetical protein DO70_4726 [Burkholderia pseudomallei]|nr:hypothetical protein DO70_4726 [Burkholderia pseudomallei]